MTADRPEIPPGPTPASPPRARRSLLLAAVPAIGLGLRLGHWWLLRDAPFVGFPIMDAAAYLEAAKAIAAGDWLARGHLFLAPLYPYLVALALRLSGSIDLVYLAQIGVAVLALVSLQRTGARLGGPRVGLLAAALAALCGPLVFHDVLLLKESLSASLSAALLALLVGSDRERAPVRRWLLAGAAWGAIAMLRENAILLLPFLAVVVWLERPRPRAFGARLGALLAGFALVSSPFVARSLLATGSPFPSYNAGFNLYIGNNPHATGTYRPIVPGKTVVAAEGSEPVRLASRRIGRELSPAEASRYWMRQSLGWMAENPADALRLQLRKLALYWEPYERPDSVDYYWIRSRSPALRLAFVEVGALALLAAAALWTIRHDLRRWAPVLLWVAGWTLATIPFFVFSRFRVPMLPALCLLAAVPIDATFEAFRRRRSSRGIGGAILVGAAFLFPHTLGHAPDRGLVAFNLGGIHAERGDLEAAVEAYRAALAEDPSSVTALLRLGDLALERGDVAESAGWYRRAVEAGPGSDEAWARYGRSLAFAGDREAATEALRRALALDPGSLVALHGEAHLALLALDVAVAGRIRDRVADLAPGHPLVELLDRQIATAKERRSTEPAWP